MASINLTKLKPGKTYIVKVRALDADGNYSQYSFNYVFTVPATNIDGTQLTATNNAVVTALAPSSSSVTGGALVAGGLDANGVSNAGALNLGSVWNGTASSIAKLTGTASAGAVIINSTGILGYQLTSTSSGQANFFLDTASGNAYFRGTVYAGAGNIGGFNLANTSLYTDRSYTNLFSTYDPSFETNWQAYWTASATQGAAGGPATQTLTLSSDSILNPVTGIKYAKLNAYSFGTSQSTLVASTMRMVMYKDDTIGAAFSMTDLNMIAGNNYTFSAYGRSASSSLGASTTINSLYLKVDVYSASTSGSLIKSFTSASYSISTSSWTRMSTVFTPSAGNYFVFSIVTPQGWSYGTNGPTIDATFLVDAIQLESGSVATTWLFNNYFNINTYDFVPFKLATTDSSGSYVNTFIIYANGDVFSNGTITASYMNLSNSASFTKPIYINNTYYGFDNASTGSTNIVAVNSGLRSYSYAGGINNSILLKINSSPETFTYKVLKNNVHIGTEIYTEGNNNVIIGSLLGSLYYGNNNTLIGNNINIPNFIDNYVVIADGSGNIKFSASSSGITTISGLQITSNTASLNGVLTVSSSMNVNGGNINPNIRNTIFGYRAADNSTGSLNVAIGASALIRGTSISSVAIGDSAGYFGGRRNVVVGASALTASNSGYNIAIGTQTLQFASGQNNVAIGDMAGLGYSGNNGVIIGGYSANLDVADGIVVIADGLGSVRIRANSNGLVTIPGTASVVGNITASSLNLSNAFNGSTGSFTGRITASALTLSNTLNGTAASFTGKVTAASFAGDGSGLTGLVFTASGSSSSFSGIVYAASFVGDGSGLTGIGSTPTSSNQGLTLVYSGTFGTSASNSFNNIFTSTYPHYKVILEPRYLSGLPPAVNFAIRFRSSGADITASTYIVQISTLGNAYSGTAYNNAASAVLNTTVVSTPTPITIEFLNPAISASKYINGQMYVQGVGGNTNNMFTVSFSTSATYDGFTLYSGASTASGYIRVYGYPN